MIDKKDILVLDDDKEYVVVSKIEYEHKTYFYLLQVDNQETVMFGYMENDEFVSVDDPELIKKLLPLFADDSKELLEKINNQ